jgi:hypothetical protein
MNQAIRRIVSQHGPVALFALTVPLSTGCGALSAVGNPGAMWAINDPAPLAVVVRRADAAAATTVEVNRLLTATPIGADSDWLAKVAPDPKDAAADMKMLSQDPDYMKSHARVVAAEVWIRTLPAVQSPAGDKPNLLAAIDQDLADSYTAIVAKQQEMASLDVQIETEKAARDADGVSADDKKAHDDTIKTLQKQEDDDDKAVGPLKKDFLGKVKGAAAKVSLDDQKRFAPAVANMLAALNDADISNSAAAIKYPLVIKTLPDAIKSQVPTIAGDVIEEQTGARPALANLKVKLDMSGSKVSVGVDGLGDLGSLSVTDATKQIVVRSGAWAVHAMTLLGTISSTKNTINFERDVLSQLQTAWAPAAGSVVVVFKVPEATSPEVMAAVAAPHISVGGKVAVGGKLAAGGAVAVGGNVGAAVDVKGGVAVKGAVAAKGGAAAAAKPDPKAAAAAGKKPAPAAPAKKDDKK